MARLHFANQFRTTLSAAINNVQTSIGVTSVAGRPATPFKLTIIVGGTPPNEVVEIVDVTGVAGTTLTVTRGTEGTSAVAHAAGAVAENRLTAGTLDAVWAAGDAHAADGTRHTTVQAFPAGTDFNGWVAQGVYHGNFTAALTNEPLVGGTNSRWLTLVVQVSSQAHIVQTLTYALGWSAGRIFWRRRDTTAWSAWVEYESTAGAQSKVDVLSTTVPLLAGRAGGQTIRGGVNASENLTLDSTAHATKGNVSLNPTGGNVIVGAGVPGERFAVGYGSNVDIAIGSATNNKAYLGSFDNNVVFAINRRVSDGVFANPLLPTASFGFFTSSGNSAVAFFTSNVNGVLDTERMRINNIGHVGVGTSSPSQLLDINGNTIRLRTARTPASATAPGEVGEICWDANFVYVCTATNTWRRAALAAW